MNLKAIPPRRPDSASEWFVRLHESTPTQATSDEFIRWLDDSPENERAYEDHEAAWALSLELRGRPGLGKFLAEAEAAMAAGGRTATPARRPWRRMAVAAGVLLVFAVAGIVGVGWRDRPMVSEQTTAKGEQRQVALSDGSSVLLNTATRIRIRFTRTDRVIELEAGEALFSVAKNPQRPFEVRALNEVTTATGTRFDVRLKRDRAEVTVLEGLVRVGPSAAPAASDRPVAAGQALDYSVAGDLSPLRPADGQRIDAWRANRILFDDTPLNEAIDEYNRYGSLPIVIKSAKAGERRVHGVFRVGDEPSFIRALEQGLPVKAVQAGGEIDLLDK